MCVKKIFIVSLKLGLFMETTILIEKRFENDFRESICKFDSMAIATTIEPTKMKNWIYMVIEDTGDEEIFVMELFEFGRLFEMCVNIQE